VTTLADHLPDALRECLVAGVLCNDSQLKQSGDHWTVVGDPTEGALIAAAAKADLNQAGMTSLMPRLDSIPFESEYQYMATLHDALPRVIYVKGSVEALLQRCSDMMTPSGQLTPLDQSAD
jgi:cation-transporting ATPase F